MTEKEHAEESFAFIVDSLSTVTIPFIQTLGLIREMGKRADNGDNEAKELLKVVYRFERLLKLHEKFPKTQKESV